jgi:hypothetical protein
MSVIQMKMCCNFSHTSALFSLFLMGSGCVLEKQADPAILSVSMMDATSDKARYVARTPNGKLIEVVVSAEAYSDRLHGPIRMDGERPTTVLKGFHVSINGLQVVVPLREYAGFGDPHIGSGCYPLKIEFMKPDLIYVRLSGGDGGGAHERRLVFSSSRWLRTEYRDPETWEFRIAREALPQSG